MRSLTLIFCLFFASSLYAAEPIKWSDNYAKTYYKSIEENKPIVVFLTMDGCPPCNYMKGTTFKDSTVIQKMKDFLPLKLKYRQNSEVSLFKPSGFPTIVVVKNKKMVFRKAGAITPANFGRILDKYK